MNRKKSSVPEARTRNPLPGRVPFAAIPTGETLDLRQWAQPVVWTDRMLTTLTENQVRGGKWHALIDKVYAEGDLITAARNVTEKKKAGGVDGQSCEAFAKHLLVEIRQLSEQIKAQTYRPSAVRRVHIPKPGKPNARFGGRGVRLNRTSLPLSGPPFSFTLACGCKGMCLPILKIGRVNFATSKSKRLKRILLLQSSTFSGSSSSNPKFSPLSTARMPTAIHSGSGASSR